MARIRTIKRAIPQESRRALAMRAGLSGPGEAAAFCHWCGSAGVVAWMTRAWVVFSGLEIDHIVPECMGGGSGSDNLVLACRTCNRSRGWRHAVPMRTGMD